MSKKIENIVKHADVSEKAIERYLLESVKACGGICLKYSNANMVGYPDRVCLLPRGTSIWVELKSKGEKPSAAQEIRFRKMGELGHPVFVCDCKGDIDRLLRVYRGLKKD